MGFLSHRGPGVAAAFLNTLEKLGGLVPLEQAREPLLKTAKTKIHPLWGAAGLAAGLGLGAKARAAYGPKAFWPMAILGAMSMLGAAKLMKHYEQGGISSEERTALEMIQHARQLDQARRIHQSGAGVT